MPWVKVGEWVLNTDDISAVHYAETPDGPTVGVYTRSGRQSHWEKGGFHAEGEEAERLWAWFVKQSDDVMAPATRQGKTTSRRATGAPPASPPATGRDLTSDGDVDALLRRVTARVGANGQDSGVAGA
jgi:hypothetical protein